ncbi:unnamed protein product [Auanema sp. JU1783]|nr:unnamed protein product [Auanema sp. JU1783]
MALRRTAALSQSVKFAYDNAAVNWLRKFSWNNLWGGREYGLQFHDTYFEPAPEVTEALRRLNLKEPHLFDARKERLARAHTLSLHGEKLPKSAWTKWEEESWYLKPYLDEIESEKKARAETSGLIPPFEMKQH